MTDCLPQQLPRPDSITVVSSHPRAGGSGRIRIWPSGSTTIAPLSFALELSGNQTPAVGSPLVKQCRNPQHRWILRMSGNRPFDEPIKLSPRIKPAQAFIRTNKILT